MAFRKQKQYHCQPPLEVLRVIFKHALPSSAILGQSVINSHDSIFRQEYDIKRAVVGVNRLWYSAGIDLLYEDAFIRSVDNVARLHRTLASSGSDLRHLVKKLGVICVIPFDDDDLPAFDQCLKDIIAYCPFLSNLIIRPSFHSAAKTWDGRGEIALGRLRVFDGGILSNITRLDWGCGLTMYCLLLLLPLCPNLESLRFYLEPYDSRKGYDSTPAARDVLTAPLVFNNLRELVYLRTDGLTHDLRDFPGLEWSMPRLRRFTYSGGLLHTSLPAYFKIYGQSLRYLHLGSHWTNWLYTLAPNTTLQVILNECPLLEHFVLWAMGDLEMLSTLSHPKILWLDIWLDSYIMSRGNDFETVIPPGLLSLRRTRFFDKNLCQPHALDLPILLDPEIDPPNDEIAHTYMDLNIRQKGRLVFHVDGEPLTKWNGDEADTIAPRDNISDSEGMSDDSHSWTSCSAGGSDLDVGDEVSEARIQILLNWRSRHLR
jgi:hypothetical protein